MGKYLRTLLTTSEIEKPFERGEDLLTAVLAARWFPDRIRDIPALEAQADLVGWEVALQWHGLAGVVKSFHGDALAALSPPFLDVVETLQRENMLASLKQFAANKRILDALAGASIQAIPLKGTVLSVQLYGNAGVRSAQDIDILVDPEHFQRACELMIAIGYQPAFDLFSDSRTLQYVLMLHKDVTFRHAGQPPVELHFRSEPGMETSLPPLGEIAQLDVFSAQGLRCQVLERETLREMVVSHALRSNVSRWKWAYDVLQLIDGDESETPWDKAPLRGRKERLCLNILARDWSLPVARDPAYRWAARLLSSAGRSRRQYFTSPDWRGYVYSFLMARILQLPAGAMVYQRTGDRLDQVSSKLKMGWEPGHGIWQAKVLARWPLLGMLFGLVRQINALPGVVARKVAGRWVSERR